jgi:hypothetical protein
MSAGLFTCSALAEVQLKAEQIWADNASNKDYLAEVGTLTAIRSEQSAQLSALQDPDKDNTVKIIWVKDCDETVAACTDECSVGGNELESACDTHALDLCGKVGFTIDEKDLRSNVISKEELVAKAFLRKIKLLDEDLAQTAVNKIYSFKGRNVYAGGKGTISGFDTKVNPAYWNASLFSYLALVAKKNKFASPYLLSGTNLYEAYWNAKMNGANSDGKGAVNMFDSMKMYFDVFNIDAELDPAKYTFMLDKSAMAFFSKNYYPYAPGSSESMQWGGVGGSVGAKYQVPSKNLPGVFYDVTYKVRCVGNEIKHDWSIQYKAGIFRNPVGCDLNNTGILAFKCE